MGRTQAGGGRSEGHPESRGSSGRQKSRLDSDENLVIRGARLRIVYAVSSNGQMPARDFYQSLDELDQSKFDSVFLMMAEHGQIRNTEKFRPAGSVTCKQPSGASRKVPLYEFKVHGQRILAYQEGSDWVLTNGFAKGSKLETERTRAGAIIEAMLLREGNSGERNVP